MEPHNWDMTPAEARALQESLRAQVVRDDQLGPVKLVAGLDVGFEDGGATARAAVAALSFPDLRMVETAIARVPAKFPYIPGLLSFREVPALLAALSKLGAPPDLLLCDGQGIAHPRRFGVACHLGLLTGIPSIGVAKSRLTGTFGPLPEAKGSTVPLLDKGEQIGVVLRSRDGVNPLFVSLGHKVCLGTAVAYVMACLTRYRLPETTRQAHHLASGPQA